MIVHTRKLYRSNKDYKLAGVCGGIAEYLGIDATLIRLGWILLTFLGGSGILAYLIAWVVMPKRPNSISGLEGKAGATISI
jgi:phage shock protein C